MDGGVGRVGDTEWGSTPLGPRAQWPAELRVAARIVEDTALPSALAWGPELTVVANAAFRALLADDRAVDGAPLAAVLGVGWTLVEPLVAAALNGNAEVARDMAFRLPRSRDTAPAWFSLSCTPLRGPDGSIAGVLGTAVETTDRKRVELAERRSRIRFRALAESIDDVFYLTDLDAGRLLYLSPAYDRIWGRPGAALMADLSLFPETIEPDDRGTVADAKARQARGEAVVSEYRIRRPDGEVRHVLDRCFPVDTGDGARWSAGVATDTTERRRATAAVAESEGRQRFLLELEDALRPLADAAAVQATASRLLAERLGADRVHYADALENGEAVAIVASEHRDGRATDAPHPSSDFHAGTLTDLKAGRTVVIEDAAEARYPAEQRQAFATHGIAAAIAVPLVKAGRLQATFGVHQGMPRRWTETEVRLAEATAERTWAAVERVRAERERDAFFELSVDLLAICSLREGVWRRVNPAFTRELGWTPAELAGQPFMALVHPDDRAASDEAADQLAQGRPLIGFENRIRARDGGYRWIAWSTVMDAARDQLFCVGRDVTETRGLAVALADRERRLGKLVEELQHRVRNMLAVVRAVFGRSVELNDDKDTLTSHFSGRLDALARAQGLVSRHALRTADLEEMIRDELLSVGVTDGPGLRIDGPDVALPEAAAGMMGLAVHELVTNALKFGALRSAGKSGALRSAGKSGALPGAGTSGAVHGAGATLAVTWTVEDARLAFRWEERGVPVLPVVPARRGFGRELIEEALPYQLGAETDMLFRGGGLTCTIMLPLAE